MSTANFFDPQQISIDVLLEKYCKGSETTQDEIFKRVAKGIAQAEKTEEDKLKWEKIFYENMLNGGIGAGRIMSAAGTDIKATLNNCYVLAVGDSISVPSEDGFPGIYEALRSAAETLRRGGGVGYDFSRIRPKNAYVKGTDSNSSGPCSYMDVFDHSCKTVESAGCFAGDTLINTTEGLIKIKDIVESDKDFYAITHLGPKKITAKFKNGIKPIWNVTTKYGYNVRVTKDHKFAYLQDGKIITKSIEDIYFSNDHSLLILTPNGKQVTPVWNKEEMTAYLVGAFHGNGSWVYNDDRKNVKGIRIANNTTKENIVDRIVDFATKLGLNPIKSKRPNENTFEVSIYNSVFFRNWRDNEINKGDIMSIPSFILQSSENVRAAYLSGMFEADGYVCESKSNITLSSITITLLKDIQTLMASFGIPITRKLIRMSVNNWQDLYEIGVYGIVAQTRFNNTVGNFLLNTLKAVASRDGIGFGHPANQVCKFTVNKNDLSRYWAGSIYSHPTITLNALTNVTTIPELINTITDKIKFISIEPEEETYDLEVEDVHLLSGDGFYTSNSRRGAQMGALRIDHPDVFDFVKAKRTVGRWNNFNVSVFVSDAFIEAKNKGEKWKLVHKAKPSESLIKQNNCYQENGLWVYQEIDAQELWDTIMKSNYDYAEPGILFQDTINNDNNLRYVEVIEATNP